MSARQLQPTTDDEWPEWWFRLGLGDPDLWRGSVLLRSLPTRWISSDLPPWRSATSETTSAGWWQRLADGHG